jgi:hypothetical protein
MPVAAQRPVPMESSGDRGNRDPGGCRRRQGNAAVGHPARGATFVFAIDTSLTNVSISAVVRDLDTTVSGVHAAVAIEALVSAVRIPIGSNVGDLFGRKRAYVIELALYAIGARAMVVGQPGRDHRLLGGHRQAWRLALSPRDAAHW